MTETLNGTSPDGDVDIDTVETTEWLDALDAVVEHDGVGRARHLLSRVVERAQHAGSGPIGSLNTPYVNTIPASLDEPIPGDPEIERRLRSVIRWNAMAMVVRANKYSSELGGHIASFQSLATLYEVGFNHFWHAPSARARRRPRLLPGPLVTGQLRARVPRGPPDRGAARQLPSGGRRQRPLLLPPPLADAGLLAVPDGVARDRRDHLDLPGALHEVPEPPLDRRHRRPQGLGVPRRRRDGRARDDGRDRPRRTRAARQPDLGRQLQPAAPRRPGARQRQDHPGARVRLPRRRLERDQGDLGLALGPAARGRHRRPPRARHERVRRRRVPDLQVARRQVRARALLRQGSRCCWNASRT